MRINSDNIQMSTLQRTMQKAKLPPIAPCGPSRKASGKNNRKRDYTPVPWNRYFHECQDVQVDGNQFRVYKCGTTGPVIVLLHGGGFSALTWALFSEAVIGMVECRVVAIDLRGHGDTITTDDDDLSAETMASDVGKVVAAMYGSDVPPIIILGHSMGGAIAVHIAAGNHIPSLIGLGVIDVVEGTAMDALSSMQSFLRSRPSHFKTVEHAIEWCVRSGQVRNVDSARVSMPGQIKNCTTGKVATNDQSTFEPSDCDQNSSSSIRTSANTILEEEESDGDGQDSFKVPNTVEKAEQNARKYTWRIDLGKTEVYWSGWFKGLSSTFLNVPVPKMLLLAGIDRLDKELTVGQMQGKFQMQVLPHCGHAVHEDVPDKVAEALATFMVRNKFAEPASNFQRVLPAC